MPPPYYDAAAFSFKGTSPLAQSTWPLAVLLSSHLCLSSAAAELHANRKTKASQRTDTRSTLGLADKRQKRENTISLFSAADTITCSLSHIAYTLSVFTHSYCQTCLFAPCSALAGVTRDKEPFFGGGGAFETFLRESVLLCHPQEGSPRHADPTGDGGLLSGPLSTVSYVF